MIKTNLLFSILFSICYLNSFSQCIEGNCVNGKGTYKWPNGDIYQGDFVNGAKNGKGKLTWSGGVIYEGDWYKDKQMGKGTIKSNDGWEYSGEFILGLKWGQGNWKLPNGDKYEGSFVNDKMNGYGKMTYSNGEVYEGVWIEDVATGKAKKLTKSGEIIDSYFINGEEIEWKDFRNVKSPQCMYGNCTNGRGTLKWTSGSEYQGYFVNAHKWGFGKYTYTEGDIKSYEGEWIYNDWNGYGICYYSNGDIYEGDFVQNKRQGFGKLTKKDGSIITGYFANNSIVLKSEKRIPELISDAEKKLLIEQGIQAQNKINLSLNDKDINQLESVKDADGNLYHTVRIRDKVWITENLKTKHFNNGEPIPNVQEFREWTQLSSAAYCEPSPYYDNDNEGLLYNHYVVEKGGVCPQGFEVPTIAVMDSLADYKVLLLSGIWKSPEKKAIDFDDISNGKTKGYNHLLLSGFNFLDGASRDDFFNENDIYNNGFTTNFESIWLRDRISRFEDETGANNVEITWDGYRYGQEMKIGAANINEGHYIRCYKDFIPPKPVEDVKSVTDKDGNVYKTVSIGNQIWMAEDLKTIPTQKETKLVFSVEEQKHYDWGSIFHDNFNQTQPINYSVANFLLTIHQFEDVCPQGWHLPDQGEWEILLKNCNLRDLKSPSGWYIQKIPGYYETKRVDCENCKGWIDLYRANKRGCDVCKDEKRLTIKTGKYIPEKIINYNGTNKSGLNIKPYPNYRYNGFENDEMKTFYLIKDHNQKDIRLIIFEYDDKVKFIESNDDSHNYGHVRCLKD
jgi:uncharacterized protein (TIGR02145 family)